MSRLPSTNLKSASGLSISAPFSNSPTPGGLPPEPPPYPKGPLRGKRAAEIEESSALSQGEPQVIGHGSHGVSIAPPRVRLRRAKPATRPPAAEHLRTQ